MITWSEGIVIDRPTTAVVDVLRDQRRLRSWSTWPAMKAVTCHLHGDGTSPGSVLVYCDRFGTEIGRHTLTSLTDERVGALLNSPDPRGRSVVAEVVFRIETLAPGCCRVWLDFTLMPPVTAHLWHPAVRWWWRVAPTRRVRRAHRRDLASLKRLVEQIS